VNQPAASPGVTLVPMMANWCNRATSLPMLAGSMPPSGWPGVGLALTTCASVVQIAWFSLVS
jgi:hypothetical protein